MAYDNSNSGVLFKNEEKREGKKDPDYRGQAEIAGGLYWLDAWINEAKKDGKKFLSVRFKPKDDRTAKKEIAAMPATPTPKAFSDDIPFAFAFAVMFVGLTVSAMLA